MVTTGTVTKGTSREVAVARSVVVRVYAGAGHRDSERNPQAPAPVTAYTTHRRLWVRGACPCHSLSKSNEYGYRGVSARLKSGLNLLITESGLETRCGWNPQHPR